MSSANPSSELESAAGREDFLDAISELTSHWTASANNIETVEAVLRFMESHPLLDYGVPGPLVHWVEQFYRDGYEQKLLDSIARTPTPHTVWMLNRVINGVTDPQQRRIYTAALKNARQNPGAGKETLERIDGFLRRLQA